MKTEKKLKLLGTIKSNIVGVQYYDTAYQEEDVLYLERNPYNEYDQNAIEISNKHGILGHLKRQNSAWLSELIDEGKIFLKGKIYGEGDTWRIPIEIEVYQTQKGSKLLKPLKGDNAESIIHNHLLDLFNKSENYSNKTILDLRNYYKGIINYEYMLAETILIFKLLKNRGKKEIILRVIYSQ